jgi:dolichol kinase
VSSVTRLQDVSLMRKLIHLAIAIVPALAWRVSYPLALGLTVAFALAALGIEAIRRWWPQVNQLLWQLLPTVFRKWEGKGILGSTWYALGMLGAYLLFGRDVGGTAVLFLIWGDPAAELVGRTLGQPGKGKTVAGSLGCLTACLVAGVVGASLGGLGLGTVLVGAVVATLVERAPLPPDDNFWMPILSGLVMMVIEYSIAFI